MKRYIAYLWEKITDDEKALNDYRHEHYQTVDKEVVVHEERCGPSTNIELDEKASNTEDVSEAQPVEHYGDDNEFSSGYGETDSSNVQTEDDPVETTTDLFESIDLCVDVDATAEPAQRPPFASDILDPWLPTFEDVPQSESDGLEAFRPWHTNLEPDVSTIERNDIHDHEAELTLDLFAIVCGKQECE